MSPAVYAFMGEPIKPATYNIRLSYLKQFFAWCVHEGISSVNPIESVRKRRAEGRTVNLDISILAGLIKLPDTNTFAGLRDYATLLLTLDTGIRPKELCSLRLGDIDLAAREVHIRADVAKSGVARTLPISSLTAATLKRVIEARHPQWSEALPVLSTADGTPMTKDSWGNRLEKYSARLGVKVRPYDLRHAFALQYLRSGGNALSLQRIMATLI